MPRSRNKPASRARRKKILKRAKGFWGRRKNVHTIAKNAVEKAMVYQYRDRKVRKRDFRKLWIMRINAAARQNDTTYSRLMGSLNKKDVKINRKVLADLAVNDAEAFSKIVEFASK